jgi:hypothetical protein
MFFGQEKLDWSILSVMQSKALTMAMHNACDSHVYVVIYKPFHALHISYQLTRHNQKILRLNLQKLCVSLFTGLEVYFPSRQAPPVCTIFSTVPASVGNISELYFLKSSMAVSLYCVFGCVSMT